MKKNYHLFVLMAFIPTFLLSACSDAPSMSKAEEMAIKTYKNRVAMGQLANEDIKVTKSKCEPSNIEKTYSCYFIFSVPNQTPDIRQFSFKKANGEWFIDGPYPVPRSKADEIGYKNQ